MGKILIECNRILTCCTSPACNYTLRCSNNSSGLFHSVKSLNSSSYLASGCSGYPRRLRTIVVVNHRASLWSAELNWAKPSDTQLYIEVDGEKFRGQNPADLLKPVNSIVYWRMDRNLNGYISWMITFTGLTHMFSMVRKMLQLLLLLLFSQAWRSGPTSSHLTHVQATWCRSIPCLAVLEGWRAPGGEHLLQCEWVKVCQH